jgi:hypothetical protein
MSAQWITKRLNRSKDHILGSSRLDVKHVHSLLTILKALIDPSGSVRTIQAHNRIRSFLAKIYRKSGALTAFLYCVTFNYSTTRDIASYIPGILGVISKWHQTLPQPEIALLEQQFQKYSPIMEGKFPLPRGGHG